MEIVAVTGGSGVVGRAVVRRLAENETIKEIRVLDRTTPAQSQRQISKVHHYELDLTDESAVERALAGCGAVVHCAHPPIPSTYQERSDRDKMWSDSLEATEILIDKMIVRHVRKLVHVGDAYSALPIEDNYGLGEDIFCDYPKNYLLGEYGEARTRAEMYARKAAQNDAIDAIFLRPVLVHGEGVPSETMTGILKLAKKGNIPYIEGDRRGMQQFIYVENLAAIIEKALQGIVENPKKFSNEIVYCLDDTNVTPFREFLSRRTNSEFYGVDHSVSFAASWLTHYYYYLRHLLGLTVPEGTLAYPLFRMLFEKTIGFSNRKQRLLLDHVPEVSHEKALLLSENLTDSPLIDQPSRG